MKYELSEKKLVGLYNEEVSNFRDLMYVIFINL